MKIKFYAHACFRLEGDGLSIITDPYTPGPGNSQFDPINEPADLVVMSSDDDRFHSDPSHVQGTPTIINALKLPVLGGTVKGIHLMPYPTMESLTHDFGGRDPNANAMYSFILGGIRMLHMGDVGNPLLPEVLEALRGKIDLLFALTGGNATIALDDLDHAIRTIAPRVVIPMHYFSPKGRLKILPLEEFTKRYDPADVTYVGKSELDLTPATLPKKFHIYVLEQSR